MSSRYGLHDKIRSGKYAGRTPRSLIKGGADEIKHLLWWRDQKSSKGYPAVLFGMDVHHALDQILRVNPEKFPNYKPKFSVTEFDLYIAEQRLKHKAATEATKAAAEAERLKREAERLKREIALKEKLKEQRLKAQEQAEAERKRELAYLNTWGAWT